VDEVLVLREHGVATLRCHVEPRECTGQSSIDGDGSLDASAAPGVRGAPPPLFLSEIHHAVVRRNRPVARIFEGMCGPRLDDADRARWHLVYASPATVPARKIEAQAQVHVRVYMQCSASSRTSGVAITFEQTLLSSPSGHDRLLSANGRHTHTWAQATTASRKNIQDGIPRASV